jgi:photosystem II stability/assembly factor-like uncharacterized protein
MAFAIDPLSQSTLYAGTASGVFKSTDGGTSWNLASSGLGRMFVTYLAVDPQSPATLYAGTDGGVFKSTTGAATWSELKLPVAERPPMIAGKARRPALARGSTEKSQADAAAAKEPAAPPIVAPEAPGSSSGVESAEVGIVAALVLPSGSGTIFAGTARGVFKAADGDWAPSEGPLSDLYVSALAVDPGQPSTLYAATDGAGVFKSTDGGKSWVAINEGLANFFVTALALGAGPHSTALYAATDAGIFKTTTEGSAWVAVNSGLTDLAVSALAVEPASDAVVYAGSKSGKIFKTTDGASNWTETGPGLARGTVRALTIPRSVSATIYAGTENGVFKSTNAGGSWSPANTGLSNISIMSLVTDPDSPSHLFACTAAGLSVSHNSGGSWTAVSPDVSSGALVVGHDSAGPVLYAGGNGTVLKSIDGGKSWKGEKLHPKVEAPPH